MTVALVGKAFPSGTDPALQVGAFGDDILAPDTPLRIRFINAIPSISLASFGTGSLGAALTGYDEIFPAVPFGQPSAAIELDAMVSNANANGYAPMQAFLGQVLSVHPRGASRDSVVSQGLVLTGVTMSVIGVAGVTSASAVSLVSCIDSAGTIGALSDCRILP
jgi:hypothetical protein